MPRAGDGVVAVPEAVRQRRQRLLTELQGRRLEDAYARPDVRQDMVEEARSPYPDRLLDAEQLAYLDHLNQERLASDRAAQAGGLIPTSFLSTDKVVIVPGLMGSELSDTAPGGRGLIWLSPAIAVQDRMAALELAPYQDGAVERDADPAADVEAAGVLPLAYALLRYRLALLFYDVEYHPFDWRKNVEWAARSLAARLRALADGSAPVHVVAHSQGALVALRALRLLRDAGEAGVLDRIRHLVLLGPATYGSFAAAFAVAGTHSLIDVLRQFTVEPAAGFQKVLASMSGMYQLLPAEPARVPWVGANPLGTDGFWGPHVAVDADRLGRFYGWAAANLDVDFFKAKTSIVLGDNHGGGTFGGAVFDGDRLVPTTDGLSGDGTVPHSCSVVPGTATYQALNTEHAKLGLYPHVIEAVRDLLADRDPTARTPRITAASDDPASYTGTVPLAPAAGPALAGMLPGRLDAPARAALADPAGGLEQVVRSAVEAAARDRVRVRVTVDVSPRPG